MEKDISLKLAFYGGAGIGLLFGVLMGTSVTPTVGTMIAALTALLAAILGLNDQHFNNAKSVRIGSFGFACVLGAYLGVFVRSHNLLSPSLISLKAQYLALGFSEQQALNFIAQTEFGTGFSTGLSTGLSTGAALGTPANKPEANETVKQGAEPAKKTEPLSPGVILANAVGQITSKLVGNPPAAQKTPMAAKTNSISHSQQQAFNSKKHSSVLFSAPVSLSGCDELLTTDDTLPLDELINNFELTGGVWENLVYQLPENLAAEKQKTVLLSVKDAVCKVEQVQPSTCKVLTPVLVQETYPKVLAAVKATNLTWQKVASAIDLSDLSPAEKLLSLQLAKTSLCKTPS